jgi:hypothetical protein
VNGFSFKLSAQGSGSIVTVTPSAGTCNGSSTCTVLQGQSAIFTSTDATNLIADIHDGTVQAGTNISLSRSNSGVTVTASTGTVSTTGSPASGNLAKFSGASSITNGDLSGDCSTNLTLVVTCAKVNGTAYPAGGALTTNTVPVVTGVSAVTYETVPNAALTNSATTVNGIACTLGSTCDLGNGLGTNRAVMLYEGTSSPFNTTGAGLNNQVLQSRGGGSTDPNFISIGDLTSTDTATASGAVNVLAACPSPAISNNNAGKQVWFLPNLANTTTNPSLNVCTNGALTITRFGTGALVAGDLSTTAYAHVVSDGTHWQLINPQTVTGGSATAWSSLLSAAGPLTLTNAGNASEFDQTSAVNWTWKNTTAATSGTPQNSPILNLIGSYWNGSAGAVDTWTMQNVIGAGTNAPSTLTFAHLAGSTGLPAVSVPALELGASSSSSAVTVSFLNAAAGTTNGLIAKLNGTSNTVATVGTTDTVAIGIVLSGGGTSGSANVAVAGVAPCTFANSTTAGDYVQISAITGGDCVDVSSSVPTSGTLILGRVVDGGAAGTHNVALALTPTGNGVTGMTVGQIPIAASATFITSSTDFPEIHHFPAANQVGGTVGGGFSNGTCTFAARSGTNVVAGVAVCGTSQTFYIQDFIPLDWDTGTLPYVRLFVTQGANTTASQTISFKIQGACGTTDDAAFNATGLSLSNATTTTTANQQYQMTVQTNSAVMTSCTAGSPVNFLFTAGTAPAGGSPNIQNVNITWPRKIVVQAN